MSSDGTKKTFSEITIYTVVPGQFLVAPPRDIKSQCMRASKYGELQKISHNEAHRRASVWDSELD